LSYPAKGMPDNTKDVFLCHAREDKDAVVRPLRQAFERAGISCWLDEAEIRWGESISQQIENGLSISRYLLVVLSPAFIETSYAQNEMRTALHPQLSTGEVRVLPLLVGAADLILKNFPFLRDREWVVWSGNSEEVVQKLLPLLRAASRRASRVCFISSEFPPHVLGGLGVHVEHLTAALGVHLDVDVVLPSPDDVSYQTSCSRVHLSPLANAHATYEDPTSWLRFSELAAQQIIRRARQAGPPDIIHCHDWVTVLAGIKCRWVLKVPLAFHLHLPNRHRLCAAVENLGISCADLLTVNSEAMHVELLDRHLSLRCNIEVVKNGVDLDVFHPCAGWPADDGYILFFGRLVRQKGVEHLLRALCYVREKFPDAHLKIVGDGDYRNELEELCAERKVAEQVEFLGWVTGPDLVHLYQRARVVAIPSIYEPFGITALESLACRRPVVASRVGGLQENILHEVTGYLFEPKDELELAQWLMTLLSNPDLRQQLGEAGRDYLSSGGYTWPEIARHFVRWYESALGKSLDFSIPARLGEFRDQIVSLARERSPSLRANNLLDELFDWSAEL
jgi:glycosyltransferase involved in cell wall biosynthesis